MNLPDASVVEADLFGLIGDDRRAAVDALSSGVAFPLVIVNGAIACAGSLDVDKIAQAVRNAR